MERVPLEIAPNEFNINYLETKRTRMGHLLDRLDAPAPEAADGERA